MTIPATSKAQMRFMGAVAGGAIKKKGLSPAKAKEFVKGQHMKDLPEKAKHYSKHNANTALTVQAHRAEGESITVELGEGKDGSPKPIASGEEYKPTSSARLVMSKEDAAHYPVGSRVVLHCVPAGEEEEAERNEKSMSEDEGSEDSSRKWDKFFSKYEGD